MKRSVSLYHTEQGKDRFFYTEIIGDVELRDNGVLIFVGANKELHMFNSGTWGSLTIKEIKE